MKPVLGMLVSILSFALVWPWLLMNVDNIYAYMACSTILIIGCVSFGVFCASRLS